jgi:hypothetical protein
MKIPKGARQHQWRSVAKLRSSAHLQGENNPSIAFSGDFAARRVPWGRCRHPVAGYAGYQSCSPEVPLSPRFVSLYVALTCLSGWINRKQRSVIEYLQAENKIRGLVPGSVCL